MSRKFRVTIGGITYNVEVEEVATGGNPAAVYPPATALAATPAAAPPPPAPARPAAAPPSPAPAPAPAAVAGGFEGEGAVIRAPLPGMVVAVKVEVGQKVSPGDVVLVLEAMKMENDITATGGGVVKQVMVSKGTAVSLGDPLLVIA